MKKLHMNAVYLFAVFGLSYALEISHYKLDGGDVSYKSAREFCQEKGQDLCTHQQICGSGNIPIVSEPSGQDSWVPILDKTGDWTQIGDSRKCYKHFEHYGPTAWGDITGHCGQWGDAENACRIKGHILCCAGVEVNSKFATWESTRAYCLSKGKDLCRSGDICRNGLPIMVGDLSGRHMTAIIDKYNSWLGIGMANQCVLDGKKSWGNTVDDRIGGDSDTKTRVLCCDSIDKSDILWKPKIHHFYLQSNTLTWSVAKQFCKNIPGFQMCSASEICPNGIPVITGAIPGDHWAPIRDTGFGYNNWVEIGMDNNLKGGRVCITHDVYGPTSWGDVTGVCPTWTDCAGKCPHKGNVFCCKI